MSTRRRAEVKNALEVARRLQESREAERERARAEAQNAKVDRMLGDLLARAAEIDAEEVAS